MTCYRGFDLVQGQCLISDNAKTRPADPGCKIWDWDQQVCTQCSYRWVFLPNATCKQVSDLCDTYSGNGSCLTCYKGYALSKAGNCEVSENDYCLFADNMTSICIECYPGYIIDNGLCTVSNPLCKTANKLGECTSCYRTYVLYKKVCMPLVTIVNLAEQLAVCCPDKLV